MYGSSVEYKGERGGESREGCHVPSACLGEKETRCRVSTHGLNRRKLLESGSNLAEAVDLEYLEINMVMVIFS